MKEEEEETRYLANIQTPRTHHNKHTVTEKQNTENTVAEDLSDVSAVKDAESEKALETVYQTPKPKPKGEEWSKMITKGVSSNVITDSAAIQDDDMKSIMAAQNRLDIPHEANRIPEVAQIFRTKAHARGRHSNTYFLPVMHNRTYGDLLTR